MCVVLFFFFSSFYFLCIYSVRPQYFLRANVWVKCNLPTCYFTFDIQIRTLSFLVNYIKAIHSKEHRYFKALNFTHTHKKSRSGSWNTWAFLSWASEWRDCSHDGTEHSFFRHVSSLLVVFSVNRKKKQASVLYKLTDRGAYVRRRIQQNQLSCYPYVSGRWEETWEPVGNPRKHREIEQLMSFVFELHHNNTRCIWTAG